MPHSDSEASGVMRVPGVGPVRGDSGCTPTSATRVACPVA